MAAFLTAEDEKLALAHTAEPAINAVTDAESLDNLTTDNRRCRRSAACRTVHCIGASLFVLFWFLLAFRATSMVIGLRSHAMPCHDGPAAHSDVDVYPVLVHPVPGGPHRSHHHAIEEAVAVAGAAAVADIVTPISSDAIPAPPVAADSNSNNEAPAPASASAFSRLLDAVSAESLHDLLHAYLPDTYKHGVYPSEKSALAALHRANAPLATSIVQLARRDTNATVSSAPAATSSAADLTSSPPAAASSSPATLVSATPTSAVPTSSAAPATSSKATEKSTQAAATTAAPTTAKETPTTVKTTTKGEKTTATTEATSSSKKVTLTYTSTINGTPTVITATSVVGVAATGADSTETGTATAAASGSLQTGSGASGLVGNMRMAGVAGLLAGAALLV
ncbi:hypothetical protein CMQ_1635 [Grosmannia clavigera kw1407]|uniref:Uncharacterized protein n=1 Tax=Grosmannia clavigera (strain kw1407 / UAMH 11150) TaxID=655863 RepID=F0XEM7_GROCL|nr:uncharacterized protein CMQ_1635 [Grosmannia clavigera kw1407]EFX04707.1 hypothetical protein CMQ_1635 [Grosmannia clavigera kw1407]